MRVLLVSILFIPYLISLSLSIENLPKFSGNSFTRTDSVADTLVKMERTTCYGTCPSYTLRILEDGKVIFNGRKFVDHKGMAEREMSQKNLKQLIQEIYDSKFMEIPSDPKCESRYTDMPSVFLTIALDGEQNSVTHYHGCKGFRYEEKLYHLEEAIDRLANAGQWIGKS